MACPSLQLQPSSSSPATSRLQPDPAQALQLGLQVDAGHEHYQCTSCTSNEHHQDWRRAPLRSHPFLPSLPPSQPGSKHGQASMRPAAARPAAQLLLREAAATPCHTSVSHKCVTQHGLGRDVRYVGSALRLPHPHYPPHYGTHVLSAPRHAALARHGTGYVLCTRLQRRGEGSGCSLPVCLNTSALLTCVGSYSSHQALKSGVQQHNR